MSNHDRPPQAELVASIDAVREELQSGLIGEDRKETMRLALLAALAGEHLLLIGPPGTGKSLVAQRLHRAFDGEVAYFERLLTRFTVPEELFGPLSLKKLDEEDKYERKIEGYLPHASIAFLDEIFNANSAILNALLTLLNERRFDNGSSRIEARLVALIAASNTVPRGDELNALFDRFLLRVHVQPLSKQEDFKELVGRPSTGPVSPSGRITNEVLGEVKRRAAGVEVPESVLDLLCHLREWCCGVKQLPVSDRRWTKIVKLLKVHAVTRGAECVDPKEDFRLLPLCIGSTPKAQKDVQEEVQRAISA